MKLVRTTDDTPEPSEYVAWQLQYPDSSPHARLSLPPDGMVEMVDRLLLRIQAGLHPQTTWKRRDYWVLHSTSMQWYGRGAQQLELTASLNNYGLSIWLYPHFRSGAGGDYTTNLAYWTVHRIKDTYSWNSDDYGNLDVYRFEGVGKDYRTTQLEFDDPVFESIPRAGHKPHRQVANPAELGADVIAVTQGYINAALAA